MTTPTNGTMTLQLANGQTRSVNFYVSDLAGVYAKWATTHLSGANDPDNYVMPMNGVLKDVSIATGPTVSKALILEVNGNTAGTVYDYITFVSTAPYRPPQNVIINQGSVIRLNQV